MASIARRPSLLLIPFVLAIAVGVALGDEASDRKDLIAKIEARLDAMAGKLSGLESDSGAGDVDDALSYARELESYVEQLAAIKGSDEAATRIAGTYPGYVRDFRTAADPLSKLKKRQGDGKDEIETCKALDAEMTTRAKAAKDDPAEAEALSAFAKSVGRKGEDLLGEVQRQLTDAERQRDDVKRFSVSEGKWSAVRSGMHGSADAIARAFRDDVDAAKKACEEVLKRERHKAIEEALGRLASSKAGRAELLAKLDALLVTLSERIKDVQSQSSSDGVRGAIQITLELESLLTRLERAQGDDESAKKIASSWPAKVRALRSSLEALEQMKTNQGRADEGAGKCETAEKALQDKIRAYVGDAAQHDQAIVALPEEAERVGAPIKAGMEKADEVNRQMADWSNKAKGFGERDGNWSRVTSNLVDSTDRVQRHWKDKYDAMGKACARLVLGKEHPDVKRAVEEMRRDTTRAGESYRALRDEFKRWKAEVDQLRAWSAQDVEDIRKEFCAATDADELGKVVEIADRWATQINGLYGMITGTGDRIKASADTLMASKRALKAAPKVKDAVDKILESVAKLKEYQLKGSNNPLLKAQADYGVTKHASMQGSCDAREITISSSYCKNPNPKRNDCRLDCVKGCTIVEIKPSGAEDLGQKQATAYVEGLQAMYKAQGKAMFEGKFARFEACLSSDKTTLALTADVEVYEFCPKATDLAPTIVEVSPTIPSEAE